MDLESLAVNLALIAISVACHIWIAYTKAGPKALKYVKSWFDKPDGQLALEKYLFTAVERKNEQGESIMDRMGHVATAKLIEFMGSEDGKQVMNAVLNAAGATITERMKEWFGSLVGHGQMTVDGLKRDLAAAGAGGDLMAMFAGMKGGQKLLKDPMVQGLLMLAANMKGGNGGTGAAPPGGGGHW